LLIPPPRYIPGSVKIIATVGRFRGQWIVVPAVVVATLEAVLAMKIGLTVAPSMTTRFKQGAAAVIDSAVTDEFRAAVGMSRSVRVEFVAVVGAAHKAHSAVAIVVAVSFAKTARLVL